MKSNEQLYKAKQVSVVDYLSSLGFNFSKDSNGYYYYLSPLPGRNEKTASFVVRKKDGKWIDFGIEDRWNDIIDLAMKMNSCSLPEAIDLILSKDNKIKSKPTEIKDFGPSIIIDDLTELKTNYLLKEIRRRKVNIDIARKYCQEATVRFPNSKYKPERKVKFIAFKNDLGGYELRNKYLKRSNSPKFYTTISGESNDRNFFEGFIDFLSLLTYYKVDKPVNKTYVLNSLVYLGKLHDEMSKPGINFMYLNWGHAAEEKYNELIEKDIPYKDCRDLYFMYDDINDMLRNHARIK